MALHSLLHPFEEAVKGLTGFPPFYNFKGEYWENMEKAQNWIEKDQAPYRSSFDMDLYDLLDVSVWIDENCTGLWCQAGNIVVFEKASDAALFKIKYC